MSHAHMLTSITSFARVARVARIFYNTAPRFGFVFFFFNSKNIPFLVSRFALMVGRKKCKGFISLCWLD